jgi:hypothetical protein
MMIFLIALIPALGVFVVAAITESRAKTTIAAAVAAAIGILTGNPAYMALDLLFVVVVYWVSMSTLGSGVSEKAPPVAPKPEPVVAKRDSDAATTWVVLGGLGFLAYVVFGTGSNHRPASQPPPAVVAKPAAGTPVNSYVPAPSVPMPQPTPIATQPKKLPKSALQRCLEIKSEEKMAKCLGTLG